jgi:type VI secretion system protein ImpA
MSEELQKPPVLDFDVLLAPISEETPSGENMRYSGLYDEINEARRADDVVDQGDWQTELKVADHRRVIDLSVDALSTKTKDIQIAAWLSDSLVRQHGFSGLRDSLKLMSSLQDLFWDTIHPEIDEGDMEGRANAISWMDSQASFSLKYAPITQSGLSFNDWEDSKKFDIPENFESLDSESLERFQALKEQAERERRTTADMWQKSRAQTRRQFCEETNFSIEEIRTEIKELNRVIEERYERNQMPGLSTLIKTVDDVQLQVKKLLDEKRQEEPDETDAVEEGVEGETGSGGGSARSGPGGSVTGRIDALKRLAEIAAYFQKTEPHSPVAYLVQRAVKWGRMPLDSWLQDVIKDENVLYQLRETLGMDTGGWAAQEESPAEESYESYES